MKLLHVPACWLRNDDTHVCMEMQVGSGTDVVGRVLHTQQYESYDMWL